MPVSTAEQAAEARLAELCGRLGLRSTPALLGMRRGAEGALRVAVEASGGGRTIVEVCAADDPGIAHLAPRDRERIERALGALRVAA